MCGPWKEWIKLRYAKARDVLMQDNGAAWEWVTDALLERGRLSGDEVRAIVAEPCL